MDFFGIIDENVDISKKKELALNALSLIASNHEGFKKELVEFFNKKSLDKMLELMNDRELQLSIMQIALFSQQNLKFDYPHLSVLFKSVSAKNFSQTARKFLGALDIISNEKKIKSIQTKYIKFMQQKETITSSGWIDFNENSIGLTTWTEGEEVFTEIRYSSITDWYMKDCCVLLVSIQNGSVAIEIDLGQNYKDILPFIIQNLNQFSFNKQSEVNNIIFLANFSKSRTVFPEKSKDVIIQIERIIRNSTKSPYSLRKELIISKRKIKKIIKRKLKKGLLNHALYVRDSIQELNSIPLSEFLQSSKLCLTNCINNILSE